MGWVGPFRSALGSGFARGTDVVCRTVRGVEVGQIVTDEPFDADREGGEILRPLSDEDRLVQKRLERYRARAIAACDAKLQELGLAATLLDAELTFDGTQLFFYFLGEPPPQIEQITGELSEIYQAKIHYRRFAETLRNGCGPDCGTKDGGCSSTSCASCGAHGACRKT